MASMRMLIHSVAAALTICLAIRLDAAEPEAKKAAGAPVKPKIAISKETTYITEPLRSDGYPDYVRALNERMSKGVTSENNAAVLLVRAAGPGVVPEQYRSAYFKLLGIDPLPEHGDYLVTPEEMIRRKLGEFPSTDEKEKLESQFGQATERPWKADEFPIVAEFLQANEGQLKLIVEASQRSRCFFPVVTDNLLARTDREYWASRDFANYLYMRAMMRVAQGDTRLAWQDILCCHRLSRLITEEPFFRNALVAITIESKASDAGAKVVHYGKPSAEMARQMEADVKALKPLADPLDKFDIGERFELLDTICWLGRGGDKKRPQNPLEGLVNALTSPDVVVDFDMVLKMNQQWFDELVRAARAADGNEREAAVKAVRDEIDKLRIKKGKETSQSLVLESFAKGKSPKATLSPRFAAEVGNLLLPTIISVQKRVALAHELYCVALALSVYRAETGRYSEKLDDLVPKYIAAIPNNTFADKPTPIWYRREGDAYVLWVVGALGKDDDRRYEDGPKPWDLQVRPVPAKEADQN